MTSTFFDTLVFCLTAKCEISAGALVKCSACAEREMKSTHRRSDFTRRRVFHTAKRYFTHP